MSHEGLKDDLCKLLKDTAAFAGRTSDLSTEDSDKLWTDILERQRAVFDQIDALSEKNEGPAALNERPDQDKMNAALKPFAKFGFDDDGVSVDQEKFREIISNDVIAKWFEPSDFIAARKACLGIK